jgi:hypothetical protein
MQEGLTSERKQLLHHLPALWGHAAIEGDGKDDDDMPKEPKRLAAWIEEREKRAAYLQELERRFVATRDPGHLKSFMATGPYPYVYLVKPIKGPVAFFDAVRFFESGKKDNFPAEKWFKERNQIAKELFPEIEIREVKTTDGETRIAYIGVTTKVLNAALHLRYEQRSLAKALERAREAQEAHERHALSGFADPPGHASRVVKARSSQSFGPRGRNC